MQRHKQLLNVSYRPGHTTVRNKVSAVTREPRQKRGMGAVPIVSTGPTVRSVHETRAGEWLPYWVDRSHGLQARATNMPSAAASTEIVDKYIAEEVRAGSLQTITDADKRLQTHCSPIGLIPKHHQPGKYRLIVNLSAPEGSSVNNAISSDLASVQYTTVRKAALQVAAMGRGALLTKLDIHSAYRKVSVHQTDRNLLGINWKGQVYQDQALPFVLRSAPNCSQPSRTL